jgi:MoxR-like ATPase
MKELYERVRGQVASVVIGQDEVVAQVMAAFVAGGHVLLTGPPGVAKTLLARTIAKTLGVTFTRAQFTPDMLPSDLTGTMVLRGAELTFRPGPVFTNILLADEINRTPPKTQAALLEAMQEGHVSIDAKAHPLPSPFLVIATQNPIEYEGTYPLPEAQLDRFLLSVEVGYPSQESELAMLAQPRTGLEPATLAQVQVVGSADDLLAARQTLTDTSVSDEVAAYVVALVRRTRELPSVTLGASPRAAVHLLQSAKATARLSGRAFVTPDDVVARVGAVLAHRLVLSPDAELERFSAQDAVNTALADVPVPR